VAVLIVLIEPGKAYTREEVLFRIVGSIPPAIGECSRLGDGLGRIGSPRIQRVPGCSLYSGDK